MNSIKTLLQHNKIAIISHIRPDGDTVGSGLALYYFLSARGKTVSLFCDSIMPSSIASIKGSELYSSELTDEMFDAVVAVDCGSDTRMGKFLQMFNRHAETYNIDHHKSNNNYGKYNLVRPMLSSNCELIFDLFKHWGGELNFDIARALYSGIYTDTGGFSHSNATSKVHRIAAELIEFGLDVSTMAFNLFKEKSMAKLKLTERVLRSLRMHLDNRLSIITITREDIEQTNCEENDVDGFIDIATSVKGCLAAASILQTSNGKYKVGLRSKCDEIDVSEIAAIWGGGGHVRASGLMTSDYYEDIIERLLKAFKFAFDNRKSQN